MVGGHVNMAFLWFFNSFKFEWKHVKLYLFYSAPCCCSSCWRSWFGKQVCCSKWKPTARYHVCELPLSVNVFFAGSLCYGRQPPVGIIKFSVVLCTEICWYYRLPLYLLNFSPALLVSIQGTAALNFVLWCCRCLFMLADICNNYTHNIVLCSSKNLWTGKGFF